MSVTDQKQMLCYDLLVTAHIRIIHIQRSINPKNQFPPSSDECSGGSLSLL